MTTWPGFGDGTFHDPDRYVREGLAEPTLDELRSEISNTVQKLILEAFRVNLCPVCHLAICNGHPHYTSPHWLPDQDAPEVTEAMKIMYPEE